MTWPPMAADAPPDMQSFWSDRYRHLDHAGWGLDFFARMLAPAVRGKRVLELGCGAGHLTARLAPGVLSVTAVDFVPELLAIAESRVRQSGSRRVRFVEQDLLELDLNEQFDCICGVAILHEIPAESYPELFDRVKRHLRPGGFCVFQENSFFNPLYRFLRRRVVGRAGVRKVGSADETPFDQRRWDLVRSEFRYAERTCDVFVLFDRVWFQFVHERVRRISPRVASAVGAGCAGIDQFISRNVPHNRATLYWSWLQTVYFSDSVPRVGVLPDE